MHPVCRIALRGVTILAISITLIIQPISASATTWPLFDFTLALDGMDDYASAPDSASLDLGTGALDDFTIELFFYVPDLTNTTNDTLAWKNGAYGLYILYSTTQMDRLIFRIYTDPTNYVYIYYDVELTVGWHHVAAVFDNENSASEDLLAIFLDGQRVSTGAGFDVSGIRNSSSALNVGAYAGVNPTVGWMEEVRLSGTIRYSGTTYTVPSAPFGNDANTRALWHFDENWGATSFTDSSGNGNTLTGANGAHIGNPSNTPPAPAGFGKSSPANGAASVSTSPSLSWAASAGATGYEVCYDTTDNSACNGSWTSTGTNITVNLSGLNNGTAYYWQVRATNAGGTTSADGGTWWSFTTLSSPPGDFGKSSPADSATGVSTSPTLSWASSSAAVGYVVCYDTTNNDACNGSWSSTGTGTSIGLSGLGTGTTYYWQVRAANAAGTTYADGGTWWSFTTSDTPQTAPVYTVNTTSDDFDGLCGIDNCTLRDAVHAAELDGLASTIELQAGVTYTLNGSNVSSNGKTAFPDITTLLTINGHDAIIERNASLACNLNITDETSEFRLFFVTATGHLTIGQVTLRNGCSDGDPYLADNSIMGGAIFNKGILTLNQVTLFNNVATEDGGAIYNDTSATLAITYSTLSANSVAMDKGGAIDNRGTLTISDSTISNNSAGTGGSGRGGAIYTSGSLTLTTCTFSQNWAGSSGGGLYNDHSNTITLTNSHVQYNSAGIGAGIFNNGTANLTESSVANNTANYSGGGIFNNGILYLTESSIANNTANNRAGGIYNSGGILTILNSSLSDNSALNDSGGAIFNSMADLFITGTTFSGNSGGGGGAIWAWVTPTFSITDSSFINNSSTYDGGGIEVYASTLTVTGTSFLNNSAGARGGGIDDHNGDLPGEIANLTVTGSTFAGNSADDGGAVGNEGIASITNSTLSGNSATFAGGGLHTEVTGVTHLNFVTIASNTAGTGTWGDGGGVSTFTGAFTYLKNSIVGNNIDSNGGAPDCTGVTSEGYNLVEDSTGCTFSALPSDITARDPVLADLANNGGSTQTHALLAGSPAIDAGDDTTCLSTDQRGIDRPQGPHCDIGAYELAQYRIYLPLVIQ